MLQKQAMIFPSDQKSIAKQIKTITVSCRSPGDAFRTAMQQVNGWTSRGLFLLPNQLTFGPMNFIPIVRVDTDFWGFTKSEFQVVSLALIELDWTKSSEIGVLRVSIHLTSRGNCHVPAMAFE